LIKAILKYLHGFAKAFCLIGKRMKSIAPQGEWLRQRLLAGQKEIIIIFIGTKAMERAKSFLPDLPYTLYLPFRTSPYSFIWPVNGCEVYLVDTSFSSKSFVKKFIIYLFLQGASLINYISSKFTQMFTRN
jgi:hypothetical protein